ncbi:MAG: AmmeMemoRadiSam system protein B [Candidatus Moranbacteria bacterium]|nr:AmmeMemoRadiSam system protein B [Candidatus Moranbacteria bacterium]
MPHPLESIPGIGTPESFVAIKKTLSAFEQLARDLEQAAPDTIIVISPHAKMDPYSFIINSESELRGTFQNFNLDQVYEYDNNIEIADKLAYACTMNEMPCILHGSFLDHGALIPLHHLTKNMKSKPKVLHLAFSLMSYERHYRYGEIIQKIIDEDESERIAVIASGDLSHNLTRNAPAGFSQESAAFDRTVLRYLGCNDLASLMGLEESESKAARECGIRSIMILLGIVHGKKYKFDLLSYEGPFGVGYLTARLL